MSILKELNERKNDTEIPLMECIDDAVAEILGEAKNSARFNKFFNSNRELVQNASVIALSDFNKFNKNTRKTVTLHAKDGHERRTVSGIVDSLVKSGDYRIQKLKYHMGRKMWILKRK